MSIGQIRETLDDLYTAPGKGELIGGRIVPLMATGKRPNKVAGRIYRHLADHCDQTRWGDAFTDNAGFTVPELSSGRESFSPDVGYVSGPPSEGDMEFIHGPPTFAVEVRSKNDYGPSADEELASKRADYFEAGTKAVWDVDPIAETIALYLSTSEEPARIFRAGDLAHADSAVPGWTIAVAMVFGN